MTDGEPQNSQPAGGKVEGKELARRIFIGLDCLACVQLTYTGVASGMALSEHDDVGAATVMLVTNGGLVLLAALAAVFQWRRWPFRWPLQLSLGMAPLIVVFGAYLLRMTSAL